MRFAILLLASCLFVGCAAAPMFVPKTVEGAKCKQECALQMSNCQGSAYTCDSANSQCVEACIEMDKLTYKGLSTKPQQ